ncbi:hypothetical protein [Burkholderia glumae]|uniref:Uncharacterized protein n=1 Tax=Burkholderia glumae TaxID=337 RepID=A0AAP9XWD0_BURGL|nr:hypothetical protein [Burkholderia glumae]AJY64553.1 hypothetical protein KS03_4621 [Burkholderia glumae LMG 2196 = ATCC 33617]MCM2485150.1 hypothetical protein [Burkholderia glumae]MCM2510845.1 hypothetical protein [Burkholderia glumae]MCM2540673.1 hypothetical protein [Burkholderia glumae]MCM2549283.1 hypothetical protein [Burkholderia glumae]
MERKLMDYPIYVPLVKHICGEMSQGHFDELVRQGLAGPSTASEYRVALDACLGNEAMAPIPDQALLEGYVFEIGGNAPDQLSIEVPLFTNNGRSDAFAVFRVKRDESAQSTLYLYDILMP